jgi:hypothetical protein
MMPGRVGTRSHDNRLRAQIHTAYRSAATSRAARLRRPGAGRCATAGRGTDVGPGPAAKYGAVVVGRTGALPEMQALMPTPAMSTPMAKAPATIGPRPRCSRGQRDHQLRLIVRRAFIRWALLSRSFVNQCWHGNRPHTSHTLTGVGRTVRSRRPSLRRGARVGP